MKNKWAIEFGVTIAVPFNDDAEFEYGKVMQYDGTKMGPSVNITWSEPKNSSSQNYYDGYVMYLKLEPPVGNLSTGEVFLDLGETDDTKISGTFTAIVQPKTICNVILPEIND